MSPIKYSLVGPDDDSPTESFELDDETADRLQRAVAADPALTMAQLVRRGLRRMADELPER